MDQYVKEEDFLRVLSRLARVAYTSDILMPKRQMPRIYVCMYVSYDRMIEPSIRVRVRYSERRIVGPGVIGTCEDGAQCCMYIHTHHRLGRLL